MPDTKKCPFCAEDIKNEAIKCKHCGSAIEEPKKVKEKSSKKGIPKAWKIIFLIVLVLYIFGYIMSKITDNMPEDSSRSTKIESGYYGECKVFDDESFIGCNLGDYCVKRTEWQEGGVHYFEGECTKR